MSLKDVPAATQSTNMGGLEPNGVDLWDQPNEVIEKNLSSKQESEGSHEENPEGNQESFTPAKVLEKGNGSLPHEQTQAKYIEAKIKGKTIQLAPDIEVPIKVRGEIQYVKLQDAMNRESGEIDIANKYNQFNSEKQKFESMIKRYEKDYAEMRDLKMDRQRQNELLNNLSQKVNSGDPNKVFDAWYDIVGMMGADPEKFTNDLVKSLLPIVEKYQNMSEIDRLRHEMEIERSAYKRRDEFLQKKKSQEIEETERKQFFSNVEQEITTKVPALGFSIGDFEKGFNRLQELKEKGQIQGDIGVDQTLTYLVVDKIHTLGPQKLQEIAPELSKDQTKTGKILDAISTTVLTDLANGEIHPESYYIDLVKESLGKEVGRQVSEKVAQNKANKPKGPTKKDLKAELNEALTW